MAPNPILFAGVMLTAGRKPITFAALSEDLEISMLEKWDNSEFHACLMNYENIRLAISLPATKQTQQVYADLKRKLSQAGFKPFSHQTHSRQWIETDAQDCFHALSGHKLLPRRTLEGRLQRCAILYEQGVRLTDPVDMFEEITRYRLVQGILPLENLPSVNELDALAAAHLAWMSSNRPGQTVPKGEFVLPAQEQSFPVDENQD
jgi:hypothetical protein